MNDSEAKSRIPWLGLMAAVSVVSLVAFISAGESLGLSILTMASLLTGGVTVVTAAAWGGHALRARSGSGAGSATIRIIMGIVLAVSTLVLLVAPFDDLGLWAAIGLSGATWAIWWFAVGYFSFERAAS